MSDYTIVHHPDEAKPWFVMDSGLVFDTYDNEQDAITMVTELDQTGLFCDRVRRLVDDFASDMDVSPVEFIYMVENNVGRTIRGLYV